jgi:nucleotide-binding universal stress UspA family protein
MKFLLAVDGSEFSDAAIDACKTIVADPAGASFRIVSTFEFPTMLAADPFVGASPEYYDNLENDAKRRAEETAARAETRLRSLFPGAALSVTTEAICGAPQRVLVETAESWHADWIVVGSHGYGFWSRSILGSVSHSVVLHAPCSVMVVRKPENKSEQSK